MFFSNDNQPGDAAKLRKRAEEIAQDTAALLPEHQNNLSLEETSLILHELRVHQIELEMQNEKLRLTQTELEAAWARYFDFYDLSPFGFFHCKQKWGDPGGQPHRRSASGQHPEYTALLFFFFMRPECPLVTQVRRKSVVPRDITACRE
jgi:hypothetical protein